MSKLCKLRNKHSCITNLYQLKNDILFIKVSDDEAQRRLEIIVFGLRLNKVIEKVETAKKNMLIVN